jgi:hypothetical protein
LFADIARYSELAMADVTESAGGKCATAPRTWAYDR